MRRTLRFNVVQEALEGIFGFFQVASTLWCIYTDFQHILFLSKLTFLHNHTSSSRFAIRGGTTGKSCEGLVGPIPMGATSRLRLVTFCHTWWCHGKVREGWVRPIPMGTHVASVSSHVLPYMCEPAIGGKDNSIQTEVSEVGRCPCSGFTHGYRFYSER